MPRSTTVWAAALVLASFSGSGPLLTTAEAMPAPGPQQTQGRPRYYFPRHVKRQIVTNSTAPAAPTLSSSESSSSSQQLESRQLDLSSILKPVLDPADPSSSLIVSQSQADSATSTVTSIQEIIVTPVPEQSPPQGTGNQRSSPPPVSSVLSPAEPWPTPSPEEPPVVSSNSPPAGPSVGLPSSIVQPTPSPEQSPSPQPTPSPEQSPSTQPTPSPDSPPAREGPSSVASSGAPAPSDIVQPTPSASAPAGGLLSSLLGGIVGSTGSPVPSSVLQPTPSPEVQPSLTPDAPTGSIPAIIVPASSSAVLSPEPSETPNDAASSIQGPFIVSGSTGIVAGSTGAGIPSPVLQPTPSQGPVDGLLSSVLDPVVGPTGILPSSIVSPTPAPVSQSSDPLVFQSSSGGIVVGITTALGTGAPSQNPVLSPSASAAIPTPEVASPSGPLDLPSILSSLVSEVPGLLPSGSAGPTAPITPSPEPTPTGVLPPLVSSLVSDVSSLLSSAVPGPVVPSIVSSLLSELPTPSASEPVPLPPVSSVVSSVLSEISASVVPTPSGVVPSSGVPTPSGAVPSPSESLSVVPPIPSETRSASAPGITPPAVSGTPSATPSGLTPPVVSSGIVPSSGLVGTGASPTPIATPSAGLSSVPASEVPASTPGPLSSSTRSGAVATPSLISNTIFTDTPTVAIPSTPAVITQKPSVVQSQKVTGTDSATSMVVGSSIVQQPSPSVPISPTASVSGIPSSLPKIIAPPGGVPNDISADSFMGQVCFKWPLNYPFVSANDGGLQIFHYLPKAIAGGLNISESEVKNIGLKPLDTTAYQGFITTSALFTIPKDLSSKLQAQLRNPADVFWHNKDPTVNDLTDLINTACPLAVGPYPVDGANPNQAGNQGASSSGGAGDGGAIGGDIGASRPINGSAAGIATGAIVGAIAYGAAMFFVARRYRNKRIAHQRASSVPSTGSRMTYGSIPGGAAAWMHGARNGRMTPGSRGSSSSQGRSVRTQQISAPVMAENSLGWN